MRLHPSQHWPHKKSTSISISNSLMQRQNTRETVLMSLRGLELFIGTGRVNGRYNVLSDSKNERINRHLVQNLECVVTYKRICFCPRRRLVAASRRSGCRGEISSRGLFTLSPHWRLTDRPISADGIGHRRSDVDASRPET